jgi:hypothetical protein
VGCRAGVLYGGREGNPRAEGEEECIGGINGSLSDTFSAAVVNSHKANSRSREHPDPDMTNVDETSALLLDWLSDTIRH